MILRFLWLLLFCCGVLFSEEVVNKYEKDYHGQKAEVEVKVSQNKITVAESLTLTLTVITPADLDIDFPNTFMLGFSHEFSGRSKRFRPTDIGEIKTEKLADGRVKKSQVFTLEPWLSNDYAIPPVLFSFYKNGFNKSDKNLKPELLVISEGIRVTVEAIPPAERVLSDLLNQAEIKNENLVQRVRRDEDKSRQEKVMEKNHEKESAKLLEDRRFPWKILVAILGTAAFLIGIYYYLERKGVSIFKKKKEPAHVIALRRIEALLRKNYLEKDLLKEFYYELSYILREYIGNRFMLFAVNQTTEEFLVAIARNNPFDKESERNLNQFNDIADTAKYSRHVPMREQANLSLEFARSFIQKTKLEESEGR